MHYIFSFPDRSAAVFQIEAILTQNTDKEVVLQLPAWRPGRYELQNFAKNILTLQATTASGTPLPCRKQTKDRWVITANNAETIYIRYQYYAKQADAGGNFLTPDLLYINPVTCCVYVPSRLHEACELHLQVPANHHYAGGLAAEKTPSGLVLRAKDYHQLADSPLLVAHQMQHVWYEVNETMFHVWVAGNYVLDEARVLADFERFTRYQMGLFRGFPEADFHFLLWVLPTPFYHGVEHRNSTMLVLGPDTQPFNDLYIDLLGIASHELYHAWNICKIRPAELLPYDYTQENYFTTCFVAEGVTTFYGDWALYAAGVFTPEMYLAELETRYRRHFEVADKASQSLLESSFDLWLDGYTAGVPNRKVSVYHKGAIAAQALDYRISVKFDGQKSLATVMRLLWERFGKTGIGYTYADYRSICEEVAEEDLTDYFAHFIEGTASVWDDVNALMQPWGMELSRTEEGIVSLKPREN